MSQQKRKKRDVVEKIPEGSKARINVVIIGHVDAGKSYLRRR